MNSGERPEISRPWSYRGQALVEAPQLGIRGGLRLETTRVVGVEREDPLCQTEAPIVLPRAKLLGRSTVEDPGRHGIDLDGAPHGRERLIGAPHCADDPPVERSARELYGAISSARRSARSAAGQSQSP